MLIDSFQLISHFITFKNNQLIAQSAYIVKTFALSFTAISVYDKVHCILVCKAKYLPTLLGRYIVASELKDPIWHSLEWQIGSFSSEATICLLYR